MAQTVAINHQVDISCIQGVSVELRHVLPKGWMLTEEGDSFVVHGILDGDSQDVLWQVVRFVAYPALLSLRRTHQDEFEVRYEVLSSNANGRGFRVELILREPVEESDPR